MKLIQHPFPSLHHLVRCFLTYFAIYLLLLHNVCALCYCMLGSLLSYFYHIAFVSYAHTPVPINPKKWKVNALKTHNRLFPRSWICICLHVCEQEWIVDAASRYRFVIHSYYAHYSILWQITNENGTQSERYVLHTQEHSPSGIWRHAIVLHFTYP